MTNLPGVVGTVRETVTAPEEAGLDPFRPPFRPPPLGGLLLLKCSESHLFIVLIKAGSGSDNSCWIEVRDLELDLLVFDFALSMEFAELEHFFSEFELFASGNLMRIV